MAAPPRGRSRGCTCPGPRRPDEPFAGRGPNPSQVGPLHGAVSGPIVVDGVQLGHQPLVGLLLDLAAARRLEPALVPPALEHLEVEAGLDPDERRQDDGKGQQAGGRYHHLFRWSFNSKSNFNDKGPRRSMSPIVVRGQAPSHRSGDPPEGSQPNEPATSEVMRPIICDVLLQMVFRRYLA